MSRISQELAKQIAYKLTEKSRLSADKLHKAYRDLVTTIYEDQTPKEVKDTFKKHPEWFYTRSQIRIDGHGFRWENVSTERNVISNKGSDAVIDLTSKISDKIQTAKRKWEKAKKDYEDLKDQTCNALLTLKTHKNIVKELPLAAPMLPPPISNALVVSFDALNKKLERQPEVKKELAVS